MNKGKLDTIKDEVNVKMEVEDESGEGHSRSEGGGNSDKNVNNDVNMKIEIKQEPLDASEGGSESIKVSESFTRHKISLLFKRVKTRKYKAMYNNK